MKQKKPFEVNISFPGNLDYIPPIRKFISEVLQQKQYDPRFAYRTEIIVDEICNNAVTYGCVSVEAMVKLRCDVHPDHVELTISDEGGRTRDLQELRKAVMEEKSKTKDPFDGHFRGLEIVRMLSEKIRLEIDDENLTSIRVTRKREEA
jgi:anti-sigma regulatory factor (Ser/Thr protein kinase)